MFLFRKAVILGLLALTKQTCDLEAERRNGQAVCKEQANQPSYKTHQEQRSSNLAGDVQAVQNYNDENEQNNRKQNPQPQERLGFGDREHRKLQRVCDGIRPLLEGNVLLSGLGVALAAK